MELPSHGSRRAAVTNVVANAHIVVDTPVGTSSRRDPSAAGLGPGAQAHEPPRKATAMPPGRGIVAGTIEFLSATDEWLAGTPNACQAFKLIGLHVVLVIVAGDI